eukprot:m.149947 g.149947  ORF g.149947 m.149947 type:complete len:454 (-) comp10139_c0_seq7:61-1422(-)
MGIDVHERNTLPNKERKMAASIGRTMKAYLVGRMTGQLHLDKILTDIRTRLFNSAKEGLLAKNIQKFEMVLRAAMSAHANRIIETTFHKFEKSTPAHKELWTTALGAILYVFGRQPQDDQVSKAVLQEIVCREQRTLDAVKGPEHQELSSKYFLEQLLIQHGCAEISLNSNLSEKFRRKKPLHLAAPETFDELEAGSSHLSWEAKDANTAKPLVHSRLSTRRYEDISLMRRLLIAIAYTQGFVRDGEVPHSVVGELIKRAKLHAFRVDGHLFGVARERLFELLQDGVCGRLFALSIACLLTCCCSVIWLNAKSRPLCALLLRPSHALLSLRTTSFDHCSCGPQMAWLHTQSKHMASTCTMNLAKTLSACKQLFGPRGSTTIPSSSFMKNQPKSAMRSVRPRQRRGVEQMSDIVSYKPRSASMVRSIEAGRPFSFVLSLTPMMEASFLWGHIYF